MAVYDWFTKGGSQAAAVLQVSGGNLSAAECLAPLGAYYLICARRRGKRLEFQSGDRPCCSCPEEPFIQLTHRCRQPSQVVVPPPLAEVSVCTISVLKVCLAYIQSLLEHFRRCSS